jgi:hypothetical protein
MRKTRMTLTLDPEVATYLAKAPNRSALVCEAVRGYRARQLDLELAAAYREDREESARLAAEWETADAEVEGQ